MDGATVSKLLADKWKMMSDAEKSRWYTEQERMKNLHQLQHPNYKYNPKIPSLQIAYPDNCRYAFSRTWSSHKSSNVAYFNQSYTG